MPLQAEDTAKTTFVTPDGQYEWTGHGTPFRLSGAPGSFQRLMTVILGELLWTSALAYLDDVVVWSETWQEHLETLKDVFKKFGDAGMKLNIEKYGFGKRRIEFLGHIISDQGLEILGVLQTYGTLQDQPGLPSFVEPLEHFLTYSGTSLGLQTSPNKPL